MEVPVTFSSEPFLSTYKAARCRILKIVIAVLYLLCYIKTDSRLYDRGVANYTT